MQALCIYLKLAMQTNIPSISQFESIDMREVDKIFEPLLTATAENASTNCSFQNDHKVELTPTKTESYHLHKLT